MRLTHLGSILNKSMYKLDSDHLQPRCTVGVYNKRGAPLGALSRRWASLCRLPAPWLGAKLAPGHLLTTKVGPAVALWQGATLGTPYRVRSTALFFFTFDSHHLGGSHQHVSASGYFLQHSNQIWISNCHPLDTKSASALGFHNNLAMPSKAIPDIQDKLFRTLGIDHDASGQRASRGARKPAHQPLTRKDQRKAQRVQKKVHRYTRNESASLKNGNETRRWAKLSGSAATPRPKPVHKQPVGVKRTLPDAEEEDSLSSDDCGRGGYDEMDGLDFDSQEDWEGGDDGSELRESAESKPNISRRMQEKLAQDDAEIADLERKLGIKKGRKSLPKSFQDDGLGLLLDDLDDLGGAHGEDGSDEDTNKRKRAYDEWLSSKRVKAEPQPPRVQEPDTEDDQESGSGMEISEEEDDLRMDGANGDGDSMRDEDDAYADSFAGFDKEDEEDRQPSQQTRQRENPYVAPTTGNVVAKYVPPSLRKVPRSQGETMDRLRKQVQGLINRLTDANILSIVQSAEEIYQKNARGDVTEVLVDIILAQVCKPEALPDQFFVLMGGFAAAVYKIIGSSFGSHLIRRIVKDFGDEYDRASAATTDESAIPKEPSNLLTFLSQLYVFEVVRCKIIFDYMERLLSDLTEINAELLLRICRNGGRLLRRDDPQALKNISASLHHAVSKKGPANVSARTKFIVETIDDLKNKKAKGKGMDSAVVLEHVVRMKKRLGELKSQSRRLDGLTPMGVDLEDVMRADTQGKWWLIGASVPEKQGKIEKERHKTAVASAGRVTGNDEDEADDLAPQTDTEDMDFVLPDYPKKARAQGLGSSAQIAIFTALMMAPDAQTGYRQFLNLKLRRNDQLEIARVLVQCAGSESEYNPYYAAVAGRACTNGKIRFALQARLWQIFKAMGESLFGEETGDTDTADGARFQDEQRVRKVAQFYASLVADGRLHITILKPLSLPEMERRTRVFIESFLLSILQVCKSKQSEKEDAKVDMVFAAAKSMPKLATDLEWFMREKLRKSKVLSSAKLKKLDGVRQKACAAVVGTGPEE